jgi:hypothetical protein
MNHLLQLCIENGLHNMTESRMDAERWNTTSALFPAEAIRRDA